MPRRMSSRAYDIELAVAQQCAREAGAIILENFRKTNAISISYKGARDLVTDVDTRAEAVVAARLRATFPDDDVVGEESSEVKAIRAVKARCWYVDPLDGTTNFVHGYPFACASVGFAVDGRPTVGAVYNPIMDEMFAASAGHGATLNGQPISVSDEREFVRALIGTEVGVTRDAETVDAIVGRMRAVVERARGVRCSGSCALNMCSVAMGRLDGFYEIGFGGPWDCVAGAAIVQEAGGVVLDPTGGEFDLNSRRVLCGNAHVANALVMALKDVPDGPSEPHRP